MRSRLLSCESDNCCQCWRARCPSVLEPATMRPRVVDSDLVHSETLTPVPTSCRRRMSVLGLRATSASIPEPSPLPYSRREPAVDGFRAAPGAGAMMPGTDQQLNRTSTIQTCFGEAWRCSMCGRSRQRQCCGPGILPRIITAVFPRHCRKSSCRRVAAVAEGAVLHRVGCLHGLTNLTPIVTAPDLQGRGGSHRRRRSCGAAASWVCLWVRDVAPSCWTAAKRFQPWQ